MIQVEENSCAIVRGDSRVRLMGVVSGTVSTDGAVVSVLEQYEVGSSKYTGSMVFTYGI